MSDRSLAAQPIAKFSFEELRAGFPHGDLSPESEPVEATIDFTWSELAILSGALESYWFDCTQGGDEDLEAKQPAIKALGAKIEDIRLSILQSDGDPANDSAP